MLCINNFLILLVETSTTPLTKTILPTLDSDSSSVSNPIKQTQFNVQRCVMQS